MCLVELIHAAVVFQFGWTHVTLLLVVTQSHLIMQNIFEGLIWYVYTHIQLWWSTDVSRLIIAAQLN